MSEQAGTTQNGWRWAIAATVALLLIALPLSRWMKGGTPASTPATWQGTLQESLEHYQAGRYREAVASAKAAIALNPKSAEAYNNMAVSYLQLHKFDEGIQAAQEALRLQPDFQLAKNNLAWLQREKASGSAAPASAPTFKPIAPADALLDQSMQHAQAGRFEQCVATAKESVKQNARSAQAFNNLGFCAGKLKRWDEAIRSLQEAVRLDPGFQLARNNLTAIQRQKAEAEKPSSK